MFTEILKIVPQLDSKDLSNMERGLNSRFKKVAKGFGSGLVDALKGGGIVAAGLALIDKILNPLKETQDAIDKMLHSSNDISVNAKQFNTTSGNLFKLVQAAKASGLEQESLFMLLGKFQNAVAQNKADPTQFNAVHQFTGTKDTSEGFFNFIQSLQKMEKNQQVLVQTQVFGEKQMLRMSAFLQQDFPALFLKTGLNKVDSGKATVAIDKMSDLDDLVKVLSARRETGDLFTKSSIINDSMVKARDASEAIRIARENKRIQSYDNLAQISNTVETMSAALESGVELLGSLLTKILDYISDIAWLFKQISKASIFRGLFGKKDG